MSEIVQEAVRANMARNYADGYRDGIAEMVAQLRGTSKIAPQGVYRGPMPTELALWLEAVDERVKAL